MTQDAFDILELVYGNLIPFCLLHEDGVYSWVCDYAGESFYTRTDFADLI